MTVCIFITSFHCFPERQQSSTFYFMFADRFCFCSNTDLIIFLIKNFGKYWSFQLEEEKKESVLQLKSGRPHVWLVSRAGFGWSFTGLLERRKKKEAVSPQHTQTTSAEQFTPVTPPHPEKTSGDGGGKSLRGSESWNSTLYVGVVGCWWCWWCWWCWGVLWK